MKYIHDEIVVVNERLYLILQLSRVANEAMQSKEDWSYNINTFNFYRSAAVFLDNSFGFSTKKAFKIIFIPWRARFE